MNHCEICQRNRRTNRLEIPADDPTPDYEFYVISVCETCWDGIATIATKATQDKIEKLETRLAALEVFTGIFIGTPAPLPVSETRDAGERCEYLEPTAAEIAEFGIDTQADEFADYRREQKYGKGL